MGYLILVLCLVSSTGWVSAQETKQGPAVQSGEEPAVHIEDIEEWLKSITNPLNTDETEILFHVERKAENLYAASITSVGKTPETHGLLRLNWDQKQVAHVWMVKVGNNQYYVSAVDGFLELKAPLGQWQRVEQGVPAVYSDIIPSVGTTLPMP